MPAGATSRSSTPTRFATSPSRTATTTRSTATPTTRRRASGADRSRRLSSVRSPGVRRAPSLSADDAAALRGDPLAGFGQVLCGDRWVFLRPIRPGADIVKRQCLDSAVLRSSTFGGGVGALGLAPGRDPRRGRRRSLRSPLPRLLAHRTKPVALGGQVPRRAAVLTTTTSDLAALDALYEHEQVRGADTRRWDDVAVGELARADRQGPPHPHRHDHLPHRHRLGRSRRRHVEGRVQEPQAGPEALYGQLARHPRHRRNAATGTPSARSSSAIRRPTTTD